MKHAKREKAAKDTKKYIIEVGKAKREKYDIRR